MVTKTQPLNSRSLKSLRRDAEKSSARQELLSIINSAEGEAATYVELRQVMALLARGTKHEEWFTSRGVIA